LYSSYAGSSGKEMHVDSRQNISNSKKLWFWACVLFILGYIGITNAIKFFRGDHLKTDKSKPLSSTTASGAPAPQNAPQGTYSSELRVTGHFTTKNERWVVLMDSKGRIRLEPASSFNEPHSLLATGFVDGQRVTSFSGAVTASKDTLGMPK